MNFQAILQLHGKTATGFEVPAKVVAALGTSKKPAVTVTIGGHTYRSSIAFMGGKFMLGVSAENRQAAGVKAGDKVDVNIEIDNAPREVTVPPDLMKALDADTKAKNFFNSLSYSNKLRHVLSIEQAKTEETRHRRIEKIVAMLRDGLK